MVAEERVAQVADQGETERGASADRVGVIAGAGALPAAAALSLTRAGLEPIVFGFDGVDVQGVAGIAPENRLVLGALGKMRARLRACGIARVLVVGAFSAGWLSGESAQVSAPRLELDEEALGLLATLPARDGAALMPAIARWLAAEGFELMAQDEAMESLLAPVGPLGHTPSSGVAAARIDRALEALAETGQASLAQTVAVRGDGVDGSGFEVEVEDEHGTNALIRRAGAGALIVKAARVGQDRRLDLPAVGPETLAAMKEAGAQALAIEAGSVIVLDRESVSRLADEAGIAVVGFERDRA